MKPVKILVIDDEPVICKGCRLALSDENHVVETCMTGRQGTDLIREGDYDVILLDMKLPDIEGMEILRTIHKTKQSLLVIVMTGYSTVQNAVEAMKLGAFDYLSKPFTDEELILVVQRAIEKKRLVEENLFLRKELFNRFSFENIIGESPKILSIFEQIEKVAPTDSTVLLYGESGTGKELFAGALHARSQRAHCQFIAVDCSTLSPSLLESELFGHVRGAFTGAVRDKEGIFDMANGGTLFMDDVTNLSLEIQGKFLRVLETGEYKPVGASHFHKTDVRIIAATNRDLKAMVEEEKFREDLFYRLNVFPIYLPPLRERKEDIPRLAYHFLRHFCRKTGKRIEGFSDEALESLIHYDWPGNVRQLKNVVERLVIMADDTKLDLLHLLEQLQTKRSWKSHPIPGTLQELNAEKKRLLEETFGQIQKAFLINALRASNGNITRAAERVGMQRPNFCALLKKHRISPERIKNEKEN
ncbi:MAG: sigma-54 dependent transcriptional regulator [Thermodesulfobacteriota bacterium]|nr:sigma-54 dependent transcriptional regulator [Thermodesulfobacteriota bacterium]